METLENVEVLRVDSCLSTNSYAAGLPYPESDGRLTVIVTDEQTAGRGQRGNHWEAELGKNLTFSVLWRPEGVLPSEQFAVSEAVALAVCDLLEVCGIEAKVKWPNDIYVGDKKICGILIEHALLGMEITRTIAGVGINVNQEVFRSDAPNPISIKQISGKDHDLGELLGEYARLLSNRLLQIRTKEGKERIHEEYKGRMWRYDKRAYPFSDVASGERYKGRIMGVEPGGLLHIQPENEQNERIYAFKEVEFLSSELF